MTCDHGVHLTAYCGTCEADFHALQADHARRSRDFSRTVAVVAFIAAVALVTLAVIHEKGWGG